MSRADDTPEQALASLRTPALGAVIDELGEAPYYALPVLPECLGPHGGPRTDADGRARSVVDGEPVPCL